MLLIHPPVSKPSEPPPGLARLAGALRQSHLPCSVWDANLEGLHWLLQQEPISSDTWTSRARRHRDVHLDLLRSRGGYVHFDRYRKAVGDLNRLLEREVSVEGVRLGFSNYQHAKWSPLRSSDLLSAFENPEANPFFPFFSRQLLSRIDREAHGSVGFSLNFLSQALTTFAMIGFLRREAPAVRIVLGGGLVTSWMRRPDWRNPFNGLADDWIDGPGEERLLTFVRGEHAPAGPMTPDYSSFPLHDYFSPGVILPYSTSTGCYWNRCAFCPERAEGNPYVSIRSDRVLSDLEFLAAATDPVLIHFVDSALSPSLLERLCLHPVGVPWHGFARITKHFADAAFCRDLRRSGCVMLELGVESGSQEVLDREGKGVRVEGASKALRCLRDAGIATYVYLLFGTPSESLESARRTLDFTVEHSDCIDFLNLAIFNLPIHGEGVQTLETRIHYEGDLSLYTGFNHPLGWSRGRVRQFIDKEFKRHPAIGAILRHDPPHFTSNHAPFFGRSWSASA
jgi:hypothetical protein